MEKKQLSCVEQSFLPLTGSIDEQQAKDIVARVLPETVDQQPVIVIIQQGVDKATLEQLLQQQQEKIHQGVKEIVGQIEAREVKRDERLHRRVDFIRSVVMFLKRQIVKIAKSATNVSTGAWSFSQDVWNDLQKEVIKLVLENKLKTIAAGIVLGLRLIDSAAPILAPVTSVLVPLVSVLLPEFELHRKTATASLQVAALFLNHTVLGCRPVRRGLEYIRSLFASK